MLKMIKNEPVLQAQTSQRKSRKVETAAIFERLWQENPQSFNPHLTAEGRQRLKRTRELIHQLPLKNTLGVDLGSGYGALTLQAESVGAKMTAVDIATNSFHVLQNHPSIRLETQWVPYTSLPDSAYDLVMSFELIAYLPLEDHRLFFSEIARLNKKEGYILLSTPLDYTTEEPLQHFLRLAETELQIQKVILSYNALFLKLCKLPWLGSFIQNSDFILSKLEKLTEFFKGEYGATHAIVLAKTKPLLPPLREEAKPIERKSKKTIWE